ncbi:MAG: citryl-CoA lyase, partial [Steroidobacteraceae bacterium]
MRIGPTSHHATAICGSTDEAIWVRGRDLTADLIGKVGFTGYVWLLVTGASPTPAQCRILDATLVAIAEHGLVPSVQASRMTLAAAPEALQGAVAAGLLGCGSVIL